MKLGWGLVIALLVAACGGDGPGEHGTDCRSLCENNKDCPQADPSLDCDAQCAADEAAVASSGCDAEYEAFIRCAVNAPDQCNAGQCFSPGAKVQSCTDQYCFFHPKEPGCSGGQGPF